MNGWNGLRVDGGGRIEVNADLPAPLSRAPQ